MKQLTALSAVVTVLAIPSLALAGGPMNLKGMTASTQSVNAFSSRDLLPTTSAKATSAHAAAFQSSKSILASSGFSAAKPNNSNPACPEPASIAAMTIGLASIVRRRKAARA